MLSNLLVLGDFMKKLSFLLTLLIVSFACYAPLIVSMELRPVSMESKSVAPEPSSLSDDGDSEPIMPFESSLSSEDSDHKDLVRTLLSSVKNNDLPKIRFFMECKPSCSVDELSRFIKIAAERNYFDIVKYIIEFAREKVPARFDPSFENLSYVMTLYYALIDASKKKRNDVLNLIMSELNDSGCELPDLDKLEQLEQKLLALERLGRFEPELLARKRLEQIEQDLFDWGLLERQLEQLES